MRSLNRFVVRIAIPFLVVALIAAILRFVMVREFVDRRVHVIDSEPTASADLLADPAFSDQARQQFARQLRDRKDALEHAVDNRKPTMTKSERDEKRQREADLQRSIENIETATAENWDARRRAALDKLDAYSANLAEGASSGAN